MKKAVIALLCSSVLSSYAGNQFLASANRTCPSSPDYCAGNGCTFNGGAYNFQLPSGIPQPAGKSDAIIDLFNLPYASISDGFLSKLKSLGYGAIWISPPQKSASLNYPNTSTTAWYGQYQPEDYGTIDSFLGSASDLSGLISRAHGQGLKVIVDVVFHQMAPPTSVGSDGSFTWQQSGAGGFVPSLGLQGNTNNGGQDFAGKSFWFLGALPALSLAVDTSSPNQNNTSNNVYQVLSGFTNWLLSSKGFNADGLRIDDICQISPAFFNTLFSNQYAGGNTSGKVFFGECPQSSASVYGPWLAIDANQGNANSGNRMQMLNFPLLYTMRSAFGEGGDLNAIQNIASNSSLLAVYSGTQSVNLIRDQDTVSDAIKARDLCAGSSIDNYDAPLAYATMLALEQGTPTIFTEIKSTSDNGDYNLNEVIAGLYFHNLALGSGTTFYSSSSDPDVLALVRGSQYFFIVNKSAAAKSYPSFNAAALADGQYIELLTQQKIEVKSGVITGLEGIAMQVPAEAAQFYVPFSD